MKKILYIFLFCFPILLITVGCSSLKQRMELNLGKASKKVNFFIDAELKDSVRRVLVMPLKNTTNEANIEEHVYETITQELSKLNYFEVIKYQEYPETFVKEIHMQYQARNFIFLTELETKYFFDAILFPEVKFYRAYPPLVFGYKQFLIKPSNGKIIWSTDDIFNMNDKSIHILAKNWYHKRNPQGINPSLHDNMMDISIKSFVEFSFSVIFETWLQNIKQG